MMQCCSFEVVDGFGSPPCGLSVPGTVQSSAQTICAIKDVLTRLTLCRRPCTYINLRETSTVNDLVFQLVTHLYQPLGGLG